MSTGLTDWEKRASSPLLSVAEATIYLRMAVSTLYERLDQLETVRLGRRVYITRRSADAFLEAHTHSPTRPVKPLKQRRRRRFGESAEAES